MVVIEMEDGGVIKVELDADAAPKTVENFLDLVGDGFYDGLIFHRAVSYTHLSADVCLYHRYYRYEV